MKTYELLAVPEAPLHFGNRQNTGNAAHTLDYVPGTAVRGAVALTYLKRPELKQETATQLEGIGWSFQDYFDYLFVSGRVRFSNLYPKQDPKDVPLVIPLSARTCKRFGGFSSEESTPSFEPHGVCDILLEEPDPFRCVYQHASGQVCDAPMEPIDGFYESGKGDVAGACRVKVPRRTLTRTAIENETETVQQGRLYSLEAIEEGNGSSHVFIGTLLIEPPEELTAGHQEIVLNVLRSHLTDEFSVLQIGAAKTRGLGTVSLELFEDATPPLPPLADRVEALQQAWGRVVSYDASRTAFTLTLNADAIVLDELWRYCSVLDERVFSREIDDTPPCCLMQWFTDTRIVSGWNTAHRLPKADELAIAKGAAFLYTTTADRPTLLSWLQRIESHGIGERRSEGFGQVIACHPFHWEVPTP